MRIPIPPAFRRGSIGWIEIVPGDRGYYLFQYEAETGPCRWDNHYHWLEDALEASEAFGIPRERWGDLGAP